MIELFWGDDLRLFSHACQAVRRSFVKTTCGQESELLLLLCNVVRYSRTSGFEYPWDHENMFETGVVRANECYS